MAAVDRSYQLGTFRDNEDSLRRLKDQAGIVVDLEFEHLRAAGLRPGMKVLDVGSGPGIISSEIARRIEGSHVLAVDCNPVSLEETRKLFVKKGLSNAEVRQWNLYEDSPPADTKFDFVYGRLVFQHLSEPMFALMNIKRCLRPGGRVCLCDVDDRWLSLEPEPPEFTSFLNRARAAQSERGGDRHVGTKLAHYMKRAGLTDVANSILPVTSDLIGGQAFYDLVFGYKLEVIPQQELEQAKKEVAAIREAVQSRNAWASVAAFFVSGTNAD